MVLFRSNVLKFEDEFSIIQKMSVQNMIKTLLKSTHKGIIIYL